MCLSRKLGALIVLSATGALGLTSAVSHAARAIPESTRKELRAAYQELADAYAAKRPDEVLKWIAPDFRASVQHLGNAPQKLGRAEFERETRRMFPGTPQGPSRSFQIRVLKPVSPDAITVVLWESRIVPNDGKNPQGGNSEGSFSVVHRWVKQGT